MQNKSVALPINNNRHSTHTAHTLGKKEDKKTSHRHSHSMGKHKSRHSSNILSPIHRNIAAAQRVLLECVCVCVRLVFVSSFSFSLSSLLPKLCCAGLRLAAVFVFLQLAGTLNGFLFFFFLFCQG
jgi:hypothetical protein